MIRTHLFSLIFLGIISLNVAVKFRNEPLDRAECTWREGRGGRGKGPRDFIVDCTTPQGNKYNCTYTGNPHHCHWYTQGNQSRFYSKLADEAAINQLTACSRDSLEYERECPGVFFYKAIVTIPLQPRF
ncbi:hypothetical protein ACJMK2_031800 [Sinanodonta woodiana]|uniref:Secreted protein n=1 Tax=Sinanodonta woodiana TaxID=1069815 RepID=A0ABD3WZU9_SINWO